MKKQSFYLFVSMLILFTACEDPIEIDSRFEEAQIVVDAWLTNDERAQSITISETVDYFAGEQPRLIGGAEVQVCNLTTDDCFTFTDDGSGVYPWNDGAFGQVGDEFELRIELDGQSYRSQTTLGRSTRIDSIGLDFEEESLQFPEDGFYAQLYAFDLAGQGDTYWVRAFKNDTLLNRPEELTVVWDATFDAGADIDGTYFIPPLRFSINALDEDGLFDPYQPGDSIYCEVHSISQDAFRFLNIASEQITNEGIFAVPVANAPGNIVNQTTGEDILGIFNVAEVSSLGRRVE